MVPTANVIRIAALAVWVSAPLVIWPQQTALTEAGGSAAETRRKDPSRIEGRTLNRITSEPVRRVTLSLQLAGRPGRPHGAVSDAQGRFEFENLEPGLYRLSAERTGFLSQDYGTKLSLSPGTLLPLSPGQSLTGLVFELTPQGVITGKVLDEEGEAVPNVDITVLRQVGFGNSRRLKKVDLTTTNDVGEFRIAELDPGRYFLAADGRDGPSASAPRARSEEPEESYVTTFFPGSRDPAGALPIQVNAGQEASGTYIRLQRARSYAVSGKVASETAGAQIRGLQMRLVPRQQAEAMTGIKWTVLTDAGGGFDFREVPPGSYHLLAIRTQGRAQILARVPVEVISSSLEGVMVPVSEGVQLTGSVHFEGAPAAPVRGATVVLQPIEVDPVAALAAPVAENGLFRLEGVPVDQYHLNFPALPEGSYVKSARANGLDILDKPLDLAQAAPVLEVTLSDKAGTVEGTVLAGDKPAAASVLLVPDPARPNQPFLYKRSHAGADGRFKIAAVAPGTYRLYAWPEEVDLAPYLDPEFVRPFERGGAKVSVQQSSRENVELQLLNPEEAQR